MLLVLSPSKSLNFETPSRIDNFTQPEMLEQSKQLVKIFRNYSTNDLSKLMDISLKLSDLNFKRWKSFHTPFTYSNAKQALLAFTGDVYEGVDVAAYTKADFAFAQKHIRILSGLYGLLRPLDLIQPYRLEMGTRLPTPFGRDLYSFWGERITESLKITLAESTSKILINLASEEYFKAVHPEKLDGRIINIVFKENHKGSLKIIGLFAKKARGLMASYIVKERVENSENIKSFQINGYKFTKNISDDVKWVFVRKTS